MEEEMRAPNKLPTSKWPEVEKWEAENSLCWKIHENGEDTQVN